MGTVRSQQHLRQTLDATGRFIGQRMQALK